MSLGLLIRVPIKTRFIKPGTSAAPNPLAALLAGTPLAGLIPKDANTLIELDASLRENHQLSADTPEFPVESPKGPESISDHRIKKPRRLSIDGAVTDSPVQFLAAISSGLSSGGVPFGNIFGAGLSPSLNAWQTLVGLHKNDTVFDVVTGLDLYHNMVLDSLDVTRDEQTGKALFFTANLKQITVVNVNKTGSASDDIYATKDELGYLSGQIPDAVTILQSAAFLTLVGVSLIAGGV